MPDCLVAADAAVRPVPIVAVTAGALAAALASASAQGAAWASASGFTGRSRRGRSSSRTIGGRHRRVLFGLGKPDAPDRSPLLAGKLAAALPAGTYRLATAFADPALATPRLRPRRLSLHPLSRRTKRRPRRLVIPRRRRCRRDRAHRRRGLPRPRSRQHAGQRHRPGRTRRRRARRSPSATAPTSRRSSATRCSPRTFPMIHAVGAAATAGSRPAPHRHAPGAIPRIRKVTLVGKGVCFDTGGLDIKPSSGMLLMKKDMGGAANALGLAEMIMDARPAGAPARSHPRGRERHLRRGLPPRRHAAEPQGPHRRDRQHRRRGPPRPRRCADAGRRGRAGPARRSRHADRRRPRRPRPGGGAVLHRATTHSPPTLPGTARRVADPMWRMPLWAPYCGHARFEGRRHQQRRLRRLRRLDHRRALPVPLRAGRRRAGSTPTSTPGTRRPEPGRPEGGEAQAIRALYRLVASRYGA